MFGVLSTQNSGHHPVNAWRRVASRRDDAVIMRRQPDRVALKQLRWLTSAYTRVHHPDMVGSDWEEGDYLPLGHPAHTFDALDFSFTSRYAQPLGMCAAEQVLSRRTRGLRLRRLVRRWGLVTGATVGSVFLGLLWAYLPWLLVVVLGLVLAASERLTATRIVETLQDGRAELLLDTNALQGILRRHLDSIPASTLNHPDWGACLMGCMTSDEAEQEMLRALADEFDGSVRDLQVTVALLAR